MTNNNHQRLNSSIPIDRAYAGPRNIRVFILDDHEVVRKGVRALLELDPLITVVGEAATVAEALANAPITKPTVALLDVRLPDGTGITACRGLISMIPQLRCLMMTSFSDDEALANAILAGASGYVLKQISGSDIPEAVRCVAAGGSALDSETTAMVMRDIRAHAERLTGLDALTQVERDVLELIGEGLSNAEIGVRLDNTESAIRDRISSILNKLGMSHRTQAAVYGAKLHAVPVE